MKLFAVRCSSGSWDNDHQWVDSIYDSEELANKRILDLKSEYDEKMSKNPFPNMKSIFDLTEEDQEKYFDWKSTLGSLDEYNVASVVKYDLNEVPKIND